MSSRIIEQLIPQTRGQNFPLKERKVFAMFNQTKIVCPVISLIVSLFLTGCGILAVPADSQSPEQPEKASQARVEPYPPILADLSESADQSSGAVPRTAQVAERIDTVPVVNSETEQLLKYLHWKHTKDDIPRPILKNETTETAQLLKYRRWKHHLGSPEQKKTADVPKNGTTQPLLNEDHLRAYRFWVHMRDD